MVLKLKKKKTLLRSIGVQKKSARKLKNNQHEGIATTWHVKKELPGRLRLKNPFLFQNKQLCQQLSNVLLNVAEIKKLKVSHITAGVLIEYGQNLLNREILFNLLDTTVSDFLGKRKLQEKKPLISANNITKHRQTEELIPQSMQDWETTFNNITDMITIHDKDFNIIRANHAAKKILGLPFLEDATKVKCYKYYHGKDCPFEGCPSCQCLKTGEPVNFEMFEPHLNMSVEIRAMPRFDDKGQIIGVIHIVRDLSERKKIETAMARVKVEWEMTFDNVTEFIILVDKELKIIRCNKSFAEFIQKPIREIIGIKYTDFIPYDPEQLQHTKPTIKTEVKTKNGGWFYVSHCLICDKKGKFFYTVIVATNITELKNTQQRVTASEEELKTRVDELEKFHRMVVGRELRMTELKKELRRVNTELSQYKNDTPESEET